MSLYRLVNVEELRLAIREKYLDDASFTIVNTSVKSHEAVVIFGSMITDSVTWASTLSKLATIPIELGNRTAAAALIIRQGDHHGAWAVTYGMGFQLLDQAKIDGGFGQRVAIRSADPSELNSLTRTTLDERSRTDRFSIPSGDYLRNFGVGDFGELVTRLVAKGSIPSLTGGQKPVRIRGADALSLPLGREPGSLIADLDVIEGILSKPAIPGLETLEQLVQIKHDPAVVQSLEDALRTALENSTEARLGLGWPHERIDENGTPSSYKITGGGTTVLSSSRWKA